MLRPQHPFFPKNPMGGWTIRMWSDQRATLRLKRAAPKEALLLCNCPTIYSLSNLSNIFTVISSEIRHPKSDQRQYVPQLVEQGFLVFHSKIPRPSFSQNLLFSKSFRTQTQLIPIEPLIANPKVEILSKLWSTRSRIDMVADHRVCKLTLITKAIDHCHSVPTEA